MGTDDIYPSELAEIPDPHIYRMRLDALRKMDMKRFSLDAIQRIFIRFAVLCPNSFGNFTADKFNYHNFYRVRLNIDEKREDRDSNKTYSSPPVHCCTENGRANLKGKSVFYCSDEAWTAIQEKKPEVGDVCHLSIWSPRASRNVKFGIALSLKMHKDNIWREMAKEAYSCWKQHARDHGQDKAQQLEDLFEFRADQFLIEEWPYPLTSMLSDKILFSGLKNDFLIYPSIVTRSRFCNMAFHPDSADELLELEKVVTFIVRNVDVDTLGAGTGQVGEFKNGTAIWRNAMQDELNQYLEPDQG